MAMLIQNGTLVTGETSYQGDILVEDGKIAAIGECLSLPDGEVYDASGCKIFAGFIDAHTHLDMETDVTVTADNFASGTRAALAGGTTTIVDFATQTRGKTLGEGLAQWHQKALNNAYCDYGFHMAVTGWNDAVATEIGEMAAQGVTSFKVYMAYESLRLSDGDIYALMRRVKEIGGIVSCHCENGDLVNALIARHRKEGKLSPAWHPRTRPGYLEGEAVERFCAIARAAEIPAYIVHLSTREGLKAARRARQAGQTVVLESCPQYLAMDDSRYLLPGFESAKYVCSPPLRSKEDQAALWEALAAGEIEVLATDHCSFHFKGQKEMGREDFSKIPNGMPGIEHRPAIIWELGVVPGRITENQMASVLSEQPAKIFGLYPRKGALQVGADADLVIWDPHRSRTITAAEMWQWVDYTPYEGMSLSGSPKAVLLRGNVVCRENHISPQPMGRYLKRGPFSSPL